ncbi:MAG TPA: thioredoxin-like domain-containing protein [Dongiaceae bacterium]|nr:thioredoxin-like domain-containing protein [Dongiaceae bacterium]
MIRRALGLLLLAGQALGTVAGAAFPDTLTLADLANRSDRWPAALTLAEDIRLGNGAVIHKGEKVRVARFDGSRVVVVAPGNIMVNLTPGDSGLLDAANQAWAALTPAQRAIDPESLVADMSLWPLRVRAISSIASRFGKLAPGTELTLLTITDKGVELAWPNSANRVDVDFGNTDVFERARQRALVDPEKRESRIAAALQGILVDAEGRPVRDPLGDKKIFAFYFGANWCAPCHAFSPDLVRFLDDALPRHPELEAVLMSNDQQPAQMLAYMREAKMPFPAVPLSDLNRSSLLSGYAVKMIPHLVVVDRFGKLLASNDDDRGNRADPKDTVDALGKLLGGP